MPITVAQERYSRRGSSATHHAVHVARSLPAAAFEAFQTPFGLGPVIEVDTTRAVDIDTLAAEVRLILDS